MMMGYIYSIDVFYGYKIIFPMNRKIKGENVKITKLSLAAITAVAMTTGAMAEVDLKTTGQVVGYYQTLEAGGDTDLFDDGTSAANLGLQLNVDGDLGNGFGLGLQGTALGTAGLENNLVDNVMQTADGSLNGVALTKAYITKKLGNTLIKAGRQELPKSLSPFAFSENWNVFKNTFDAVLAINSDIQDTTLVGAFVSNANNHPDLSSFNKVGPKGAYMLTAANKSLVNTPITVSYYSLPSTDLDVLWADVKANKLGQVDLALQGGTIMNGATGGEDTTAVGVKVSGKANNVDLALAYSNVNDGDVPVKNVGTGVKTPLYTQMILNQDFISTDADTVTLKAAMPLAAGKLIAQYGLTTDNSPVENDYNELDVIYKFKALGTDMLAAYVRRDADKASDPMNVIRVWTRYNF